MLPFWGFRASYLRLRVLLFVIQAEDDANEGTVSHQEVSDAADRILRSEPVVHQPGDMLGVLIGGIHAADTIKYPPQKKQMHRALQWNSTPCLIA